MDNKNKKVLIVAYHFPPDAAVGALRPQKFAKYLPEFGWQPYVLTIKEKYIGGCDESRLSDVQGINITRTDYWRSPLTVFSETKKKWEKSPPRQTGSNQTPSSPSDSTSRPNSIGLKQIIWEINTFPDPIAFWLIPALVAGLKIIRREKIKVVYATIPEPTAALIGYILSIITGTQLVIDFRDPWVGERVRDVFCSETYNRLTARLERLIVSKAYKITCTNDAFLHNLRCHYEDMPPEKFVTITNGYDADDNVGMHVPTKNNRFVMSYFGTFYLDRNPGTFFQSLRTGIDAGMFSEQSFEVRLIGKVDTVGNDSIIELVSRFGLESVVRIVGQVPHKVALQQMQEADLLLLFAPNQPNQIPAKAFEYIGAHRPILAFTEEGATANLMREIGAGLVVRQNDPQGILDALKEMMRLNDNVDNYWYQGGSVEKYERKALTKRLVTILDECLLSGNN